MPKLINSDEYKQELFRAFQLNFNVELCLVGDEISWFAREQVFNSLHKFSIPFPHPEVRPLRIDCEDECKRQNKSPLRTEIRKLKEHFHSINHAVLSTPTPKSYDCGSRHEESKSEKQKATGARTKIGNFEPTSPSHNKSQLSIPLLAFAKRLLSFRDQWAWLDPAWCSIGWGFHFGCRFGTTLRPVFDRRWIDETEIAISIEGFIIRRRWIQSLT